VSLHETCGRRLTAICWQGFLKKKKAIYLGKKCDTGGDGRAEEGRNVITQGAEEWVVLE